MEQDIEARSSSIDRRFDGVDARLHATRQRFDAIDEKLVALIGAVESGFAHMQRFWEVVVEDIRSDFRAVKEQSRDHSERIQSLEESREKHQELLGQLTATCVRLEKRAS